MASTAEQIVQALAAAEGFDANRCPLCSGALLRGHDPDCPWRLAVEWVAVQGEESPEPTAGGYISTLAANREINAALASGISVEEAAARLRGEPEYRHGWRGIGAPVSVHIDDGGPQIEGYLAIASDDDHPLALSVWTDQNGWGRRHLALWMDDAAAANLRRAVAAGEGHGAE